MSETESKHKTDENEHWPDRARFQKKYQPYGVRVCDETLDEIEDYHDCKVIRMGPQASEPHSVKIEIQTREGRLIAKPGDWIMEDSEGHHYPIADEEIRVTYKPVDPNPYQ